jgi:hypothetical protein
VLARKKIDLVRSNESKKVTARRVKRRKTRSWRGAPCVGGGGWWMDGEWDVLPIEVRDRTSASQLPVLLSEAISLPQDYYEARRLARKVGDEAVNLQELSYCYYRRAK